MIKTALTMNINPQDAQINTYLVNGTHLGLLSSATQNIHVQTCHRPVQMVVAIQAQDQDSGTSLARQRQLISAWQAFFPILTHRGCLELNDLLQQYHLVPDLIICYDETRLQAWLPADSGFYLLRRGEMRRLRPVTLRDNLFSDAYHETHLFYALQLNPEDYFFVLPPDLIPVFSAGEIAGILLGLRQLPAKMSDLFHTARQRGYVNDATWIAIQVLRLEEDQKPDSSHVNLIQSARGWLQGLKPAAGASMPEDSASDAMTTGEEPAERQEARLPGGYWPPTRANLRVWIAAMGLLALLLLVVILVIGRPGGEPQESSTVPSESTSQTTAAPTTVKPTEATTSQTTTEALITLTVNAKKLNLREEPNTQANLLKTLQEGDQLVQLSEPQDDWVKVRTADGMEGYVFFDYVKTSETQP